MEITAQWLAGFVDGEGCLTIHTSMRGRASRSRTQGRLSIANTHLPTLLAIRAQWGGKLQYKKYTTPKHRNYRGMKRVRQSYELMWYNQADLIKVLEAIQPYMVTKKDQVDLFMTYYKPTVITASRTYHLSKEEYEQRRLVKVGLEELKRVEYPLDPALINSNNRLIQ